MVKGGLLHGFISFAYTSNANGYLRLITKVGRRLDLISDLLIVFRGFHGQLLFSWLDVGKMKYIPKSYFQHR